MGLPSLQPYGCIAAIWFRTAALAAALLTTVSIALAFGFGVPDNAFNSPGPLLAGVALASIVGWALRATNTGAVP